MHSSFADSNAVLHRAGGAGGRPSGPPTRPLRLHALRARACLQPSSSMDWSCLLPWHFRTNCLQHACRQQLASSWVRSCDGIDEFARPIRLQSFAVTNGHQPNSHTSQPPGYRPQAIGHRSQATCHRPQTTCHRLQVTGHCDKPAFSSRPIHIKGLRPN